MNAIPYGQVRQRPDGRALAWHRPDAEDDDAQPWLVSQEHPVLGVDHDWFPHEYVADWPVLSAQPPAEISGHHTPQRRK